MKKKINSSALIKQWADTITQQDMTGKKQPWPPGFAALLSNPVVTEEPVTAPVLSELLITLNTLRSLHSEWKRIGRDRAKAGDMEEAADAFGEITMIRLVADHLTDTIRSYVESDQVYDGDMPPR